MPGQPPWHFLLAGFRGKRRLVGAVYWETLANSSLMFPPTRTPDHVVANWTVLIPETDAQHCQFVAGRQITAGRSSGQGQRQRDRARVAQ